jgi:hypothetical protein
MVFHGLESLWILFSKKRKEKNKTGEEGKKPLPRGTAVQQLSYAHVPGLLCTLKGYLKVGHYRYSLPI